MASGGRADGVDFSWRKPKAPGSSVLPRLGGIARATQGKGDTGLLKRPGNHYLGRRRAMSLDDRCDVAHQRLDLLPVGEGKARVLAPKVVALEAPVRPDASRQQAERQRGIAEHRDVVLAAGGQQRGLNLPLDHAVLFL